MDPFHRGIDIYMGATGDSICPFRGILPYLALRSNCPGPLFIFKDDKSLTRLHFCAELNDLLLETAIPTASVLELQPTPGKLTSQNPT